MSETRWARGKHGGWHPLHHNKHFLVQNDGEQTHEKQIKKSKQAKGKKNKHWGEMWAQKGTSLSSPPWIENWRGKTFEVEGGNLSVTWNIKPPDLAFFLTFSKEENNISCCCSKNNNFEAVKRQPNFVLIDSEEDLKGGYFKTIVFQGIWKQDLYVFYVCILVFLWVFVIFLWGKPRNPFLLLEKWGIQEFATGDGQKKHNLQKNCRLTIKKQ